MSTSKSSSNSNSNIKISKTPNTVTRAQESPHHEQMMEKVKKAMARYV